MSEVKDITSIGLYYNCIPRGKRKAYFSFCAMCRANYWPESIIKESKIQNVSF